MAVIPIPCPVELFIHSIGATIKCGYVGTVTAVAKHCEKGHHQSVRGTKGANWHYRIEWWVTTNGE